MKKILFCAGVLALAASCTEDFDTASLQQTQQESGIVFTTGDDAVATRGEYLDENGVYYPFWTAEKDLISVFSAGTVSTSTDDNTWTDETEFTGSAVTYKATRSERNAYFTGNEPSHVLDFKGVSEAKPAKFVAFFPALIGASGQIDVTGVTFTTDKANKVTTDKVTIGLPTIWNQTQENVSGQSIYSLIAKYAVANGYAQTSSIAAVGENINLQFTRLNPAIVYQTKGLDAYAEDFGNLKTIKLESAGILDKDGKANKENFTPISQKDVQLTLTIKSDEDGNITDTKAELSENKGSGNNITLKLKDDNGLAWSDDARAYMAIANVERVDEDGNPYTEKMVVTYTFENITIKEEVETSNSWVAPDFYEYKTLDVNAYPYLIFNNTKGYEATKGTNGAYTVLLNSGKLSQIFDKDGKVKLLDGTTTVAANIKKVIAKPALTADDFAALGKLKQVQQVILEAQTSVPAKAFNGLKEIVKLEMPKVTSIDKDFMGNGDLKKLQYLNLASYKFDGNGGNPTVAATVNQALFANKINAISVNAIDYVDMSALEDMTPIFGYPEAQLSFKDCVDLDSVKVNNLKLRSNSFSGCTSLVKVNGSVDVSEGYAAFQGCDNNYSGSGFDIAGKNNKTNKLYTITLSNTEIAEDAFNGCTYLSDIKMDGKQVAPTSIGNRAFQDVLALQYMDLSKAATIGKQAFKGAKNYVGTSKTNDIITVIVPKIMSESFADTGISKIEFTQATSFENSFLSGSKKVVHVKFVKPFEVTGSTAWANNLFGPDPDANKTTNVTFFYAEGQKYLNGRTLSLPYKSGNTTAYKTYNFWDVQKN